jgi:hypothetical protein
VDACRVENSGNRKSRQGCHFNDVVEYSAVWQFGFAYGKNSPSHSAKNKADYETPRMSQLRDHIPPLFVSNFSTSALVRTVVAVEAGAASQLAGQPLDHTYLGKPVELLPLRCPSAPAGGVPFKTPLIFRVAAPSECFEGAEGFAGEWCGWGDSNSRPRASEARALSI